VHNKGNALKVARGKAQKEVVVVVVVVVVFVVAVVVVVLDHCYSCELELNQRPH
jgi:hypothetical protein